MPLCYSITEMSSPRHGKPCMILYRADTKRLVKMYFRTILLLETSYHFPVNHTSDNFCLQPLFHFITSKMSVSY